MDSRKAGAGRHEAELSTRDHNDLDRGVVVIGTALGLPIAPASAAEIAASAKVASATEVATPAS